MSFLADQWNQHRADFLLIWPVLSTIVTSLIAAFVDPDAFVVWCKKNRYLALIINVLFRACGIDVLAVIKHFKAFVIAGIEAKIEAPDPVRDHSAPAVTTSTEDKKP
jgi:hypothetical protein